MERFAYQFNDIPQIPAFADEQQHYLWPHEVPTHLRSYPFGGCRTINIHGEEIGYGEVNENMQPMQRFLHSSDPSPLVPGLLHPRFDRRLALQTEHLMHFEVPWPSADYMTYSPRNGSPDRTSVSGTSSHTPQNELRSPQAYYPITYGSPGDFCHPGMSYPSPQLSNCGAHPSDFSVPTGGTGGICPRDVEYEHEEVDVTAEEHDLVDNKPDLEYGLENTYVGPQHVNLEIKAESYDTFESPVGAPYQKEESVQPAGPGDESDSDYKPSSLRSHRRRSSASSHGSRQNQRRRSYKNSTPSPRISKGIKKLPRRTSGTGGSVKAGPDARRPFPCPLAAYGCQSDFTSKNEWKRHVSTQHIKLVFWRCDICPTTVDDHDEFTVYHNDFNRKDLFTQHLRRMHAAPPDEPASVTARNAKQYPVNEDNIGHHQKRCCQTLRGIPPKSRCLFCDREFEGSQGWDERMEHVGRHFEKDKKPEMLDITTWIKDPELEQWLMDEGLIEYLGQGAWKIGDGKPKRDSIMESDTDTEEDA